MATDFNLMDNAEINALYRDHPDWQQRITDQLNNFTSQFENYVGRAPNESELTKFKQNYLVPNANDIAVHPNYGQVSNMSSYIQQFIGDNYANAAKDYATQQLEAQQGKANDLSQLFRRQGTEAINATEQSLIEYQNKLFEKLRPNLLTSLKAQGLLDTGGMNEAFAGQAADLARDTSHFLTDARLNNENQANAIAYSGAAAPYMFEQGNITQSVPFLQQLGMQAMGQNNNNFMQDRNFQNHMQLLEAQAGYAQNKPSFFDQMGSSFASSFGTNAGKIGDPSNWMSKSGTSGKGA